MSAKLSLITGGSRGIGAVTATLLAARGCDIVVVYRAKEARALEVAAQIEKLGRRCLTIQADLSDDSSIVTMAETVRSQFGRVDHLLLNAAGGLERDRDDAYAYALNVTANSRILDELLPAMPWGASVVYVTSHPSHFYGRRPVMSGYERVASTKKAAEDMLRARIPDLSAVGIRLAVVSGDLIEGTINARLMQREYPGLLGRREQEVGHLPTIEEFGAAIANAALDDDLATGATILIGSTSWETYSALYAQEQSGLDGSGQTADGRQ
jgi:3-oxoacyl-[acyl-carrier protein] reductase